MKSLIIASALLISQNMWAAETTPQNWSPKQVCENLAKAATENNYKAFTEWTTMGAGPMMGMHHGKGMMGGKGMKKGDWGMGAPTPEAFEKMHKEQMAKLKALGCKDEKIAGDHAWVEATSNNEVRLVPFIKQDGQWKFDMHTYRSFYRPADAAKMNK